MPEQERLLDQVSAEACTSVLPGLWLSDTSLGLGTGQRLARDPLIHKSSYCFSCRGARGAVPQRCWLYSSCSVK